MKPYVESLFWKTNPDWYRANYEKDCYELTPLAPPRAIRSFRLFLKNHKKMGKH